MQRLLFLEHNLKVIGYNTVSLPGLSNGPEKHQEQSEGESCSSTPATRGGQSGNCPPKLLKTHAFATYSNKLHHFAPPPKISVGCGPVLF